MNRRYHFLAGIGAGLERRERRDGGTDLFHSIAGLSGGTVVGTDKGDVGSAVDLISAGLSGSQVYLKKVHADSSILSHITFDADATLRSLTIQVQCDTARPQFGIKDPTGKLVTAGDPNVNITVDSAFLRVLTIGKPTVGRWELKLLGSQLYDVTVQGVSSVDFISSFKDKDGIDLPGSPFAGQPSFVSMETVGGDSVSSWTSLITMSPSNGTVLQRISLDSPIGRRHNMYKVNLTFPYQVIHVLQENER
ncbi:hypothetical protein ACJMK2_022641 [Sinanodonta woodiana]|uniref:Hemicentin/VWA7 galactose-binding domain-containing protein n=1 Tax=Sinanodonta woodiana TaxID=1069815 RepID=A0ABD3TJP5_SINWO